VQPRYVACGRRTRYVLRTLGPEVHPSCIHGLKHFLGRSGVALRETELVQELEDRKLFFRMTELDDWDYWFFQHLPNNTVDWQDRHVADPVRSLLFPVILSPYCRGVTTWELIDKHSQWRADSPLTRPLRLTIIWLRSRWCSLFVTPSCSVTRSTTRPTRSSRTRS
jgi:hypothetical protein